MKSKSLRIKEAAGMNPKMTVPPKVKKKKAPKPYKAPMSLKKYYEGISDGIQIFENDLYECLQDKPFISQDELIQLIKDRSARVRQSQSLKLTKFEKEQTKQRIKDFEEKEWESL